MFSALIIDADSSARSQIERTLAPYGFEFDYSEDAGEGVAHARDHAPDMIFLRVELPSASGFSVCNKLRRNDETKYIPLVMYAAEVADDVFEQHRNLRTRADGYLRMPLSSEQLVSTVGQIIELPTAPAAGVDDLEVDLDEVEMVLDGPVSAEARRDTLPARGPSALDDSAGPAAAALRLADDDADDLSDETDAAFDALTLDDGGDVGATEQLLEVEAAVPVGEPEPGVEATADVESDAGSGTGSFDIDPAVELPAELESDEFELPADLDVEEDDDGEALEPEPSGPESVEAAPVAMEAGAAPPLGRYPMATGHDAELDEDHVMTASESAVELLMDDLGDDVGDEGVHEAAEAGDVAAEPSNEPFVATSLGDEPEPSSSGSMTSGNISMRRENLNLKSQIVARDRELLRLKDEIGAAKRSVLDAENRARTLEHEVGELQSKLLEAEETALTAQEQSEATLSDRRTLLKREEGLKVRLDVQQKKAQKLEKELRALEATIAETKSKHEAALAGAVEDAQAAHGENEKLRTDYGEALGKLASFEQERAQQAEKLEAVGSENQRLSDNVSQLEAELARVKRQAEADFIAAQEQADKELEEKLASQADEHQAQLEFQERASQERAGRQRDEWDAERSRLQEQLDERTSQVDALTSERDELTSQLAEQTRRTQAAKADAEARVEQLEASVNEMRDELRATNAVVRTKSEAIERAQQALAVALKVLD